MISVDIPYSNQKVIDPWTFELTLEVKDWIRDRYGDLICTVGQNLETGQVRLSFPYAHQALLFKLTWGGN